MFCEKKITPKQPGPLRVLTIGRISTPHQDMQMIEVQHAEVQKTLESLYDGEISLTKLGEQASGEDVLRDSFMEALACIETKEFDLAILFDLSKASRNQQYIWMFMNTCVDSETRFISIGDNIDTADPTWRTSAGAAALIHGTHIQHTRHRVIAQADAAFEKGGMVTKIMFGYRKLSEEEAASGEHGPVGLRIAKLPEWSPTITEMAERVLRGATYEGVARWLNDEGVPTGPYCQRGNWNGKLPRGFLRNPILHGERERSRTQITRMQTTGKKARKHNPNPKTKAWPGLAHLSPEEHAKLIAAMDRRVNITEAT